jgi:hypothetical protein
MYKNRNVTYNIINLEVFENYTILEEFFMNIVLSQLNCFSRDVHFIYFTFHWSYTDVELVMYIFSI